MNKYKKSWLRGFSVMFFFQIWMVGGSNIVDFISLKESFIRNNFAVPVYLYF
ncbi:MAG: hypothetical protein HQK63_12350 [Desulfamplus sp.]|nr:hypothetical protein [Desulfamplus sp.]